MTVNYIRLKGLLPGCYYKEQHSGKVYASDALMEAGVPVPSKMGEYRAYQMYFTRTSSGQDGFRDKNESILEK